MAREHALREIEHHWIEMADGVRLSARIWLPPDTVPGPYPALLEYIPYRKRDLVRARDERNHPVFAGHGYACLRVDMRGSGDSEGHMPDMYAPDELADARHVIAWIAKQDWCSGRVGMFGTSWGGTASLQAAVNAPGPLKAVLANCATIDRFEDDIHHMGGCLLTDSIEWGATLPAILAAPPDAATVGPAWREMWEARLERLAFPLEAWVRERVRGRYWRHGSVRYALDRLACPVLAIGGWSDRYSNSVLPLVAARPDLCWGLVGPWGHHYPDHGDPGPAMGFQTLALEWWDHWLKEGSRDPLAWPRLRLWRREFDPPKASLDLSRGAWVEADTAEPGPRRRLFLGDGRLSSEPTDDAALVKVPFDPMHGTEAGDTGYFGRAAGLPTEQSADDARALCFDTDVLQKELDLAGAAEVRVTLRRRFADAQIVCRLCDVAPDGRSNLVVRAVLNLVLDETLDAPTPFRAGVAQEMTVRFPTTVYRFLPGHRARLAIGASYWPLVLPTPSDPGLELSPERSRIDLPGPFDGTRPLRAPLPDAQWQSAPLSWTREGPTAPDRQGLELAGDRCTAGWHQRPTVTRFAATRTELTVETSATYSLSSSVPQDAVCSVRHRLRLARPDGTAEISSSSRVRSDRSGQHLEGKLLAIWDGEIVTDKAWSACLETRRSDDGN